MKTAYKKAVFIINPASGQGDPNRRISEIKTIAKSYGWTGKTLLTTKKKNAEVLARNAIADGAKHIVICGGDGTIMEALQAVINTQVVLGIVPLGTGNLLAQNLGLIYPLDEAINIALLGKIQKIDVGKANDKFFAIIAGIGFDADLMKETKRELKRKYGFFAYLFSSIKAFNKKSGWYEVSVDGKPSKKFKAKSIMIANMGKLQAGFEAVPNAHYRNGILQIAIIQASTLRSFLNLVANALLGTLQRSPHYTLLTGKSVRVSPLRGAKPYQLDGNHFPPIATLEVEIFPKSVSILVTPDEKGLKNKLPSLLQFKK